MTSRGAAVALAASVLVLAGGCGAADGGPMAQPSTRDPIPTTSVTPPAGVTLTRAGTLLRFGRPATVGFTQNAARRTTLRLTVTRVARGRPADLAAYDLDDQARTATPYYVSVAAANLGPGDVSRAAVPLGAVTSTGSLITPSGFTTAPRQCPASGPPAALPSVFPTGAATSTCLVYLVPRGATLSAVSFQPATSDDAITWRGRVAAAAR